VASPVIAGVFRRRSGFGTSNSNLLRDDGVRLRIFAKFEDNSSERTFPIEALNFHLRSAKMSIPV
jgi:hypothetical protein